MLGMHLLKDGWRSGIDHRHFFYGTERANPERTDSVKALGIDSGQSVCVVERGCHIGVVSLANSL